MKYIFILFCFPFLSLSAQEGQQFSTHKQLYLKGASKIIGNSILGKDSKKPLNDPKAINDQIKMVYIDVDNNRETFSSSEAFLDLPIQSEKIIYAAIYWSAIYKYDNGRKSVKGSREVFVGKDQRSEAVHSILFKTPNNSYIPIEGNIIFDSYKSPLFEETKPYVCYADVTTILQNLNQVEGNYGVANIRATEGYISGGSSAGWMLYIIYENLEENPKYFTTYNGFIEVTKGNDVDLTFKDFKAPEEGEVKTTLLLGALEGDSRFKADVVSIYDQKKLTYVPLYTKNRSSDNFFNSSITLHEEENKNRNPNSSNTLGFDLLKMSILNSGNQIFSNNTTEVKVKLSTRLDRFYLFFVGFESEISPVFFNEIVQGIPQSSEIDSHKEDSNDSPIIDTKPELSENYTFEQIELLDKIKALESVEIPGLTAGYYLISNVFSRKKNAENWTNFMIEKGFSPKTIIHPKNGWHYISFEFSEDLMEIFNKQLKFSETEFLKEIWTLRVQ